MSNYLTQSNPHPATGRLSIVDAIVRAGLTEDTAQGDVMITNIVVNNDNGGFLEIIIDDGGTPAEQAALDAFVTGFDALTVTATSTTVTATNGNPPTSANITTISAEEDGTPLTSFDWRCVRSDGTYEQGSAAASEPFSFADVGEYLIEVVSGSKTGRIMITVEGA